MEHRTTTLDILLEKIEAYGKTSFELYKCQAVDATAGIVSSLIAKMVIIGTIVLALFMLNIGAALWIGDLLHETYYGFFAVAGFYLVLGIVFYLLRNELIKTPISNRIIRNFLK